jgi:hypothetical protein
VTRETGGNTRFSSGASDASHVEKPVPTGPPPKTTTIGAPAYLWDSRDPDLDDALHKYVLHVVAMLRAGTHGNSQKLAQILNKTGYKTTNGLCLVHVAGRIISHYSSFSLASLHSSVAIP